MTPAVEFAVASIGRDLAAQRRSAGLSQSAVAIKAKIRVETLSRLENGSTNPTATTVNKILRAIRNMKAQHKDTTRNEILKTLR